MRWRPVTNSSVAEPCLRRLALPWVSSSSFTVPLTTSLMELQPLAHHQHMLSHFSPSVPLTWSPLLQTHLALSRAVSVFGSGFSSTLCRPDSKAPAERVCHAMFWFCFSYAIPWCSTAPEWSAGVVSFLTSPSLCQFARKMCHLGRTQTYRKTLLDENKLLVRTY